MQKYVLSILAMTMVGLNGCQTTSGLNQPNSSHIKSASSVAEAQARPNQINFRKIKQTENRPVIALVLGSGGARAMRISVRLKCWSRQAYNLTLLWEPVPVVLSVPFMPVVNQRLNCVILH